MTEVIKIRRRVVNKAEESQFMAKLLKQVKGALNQYAFIKNGSMVLGIGKKSKIVSSDVIATMLPKKAEKADGKSKAPRGRKKRK